MPLPSLNKRIKFERVEELHDDQGSFYDHWIQFCKRWANVRPVRGREPYINDQRLAELDYVVTVRFDSKVAQLNEKDRIIYSGRKLEIDSIVDVEEKHDELRIFCTETRDGS